MQILVESIIKEAEKHTLDVMGPFMCKEIRGGGMGFRKLHDFNVALLGKQGWRLITKQESMVSKIYKARYYPEGDFLSAKLGNNPSYVWRSILESQTLLKEGASKIIGNGLTIDIMNDPWLPCELDLYITTVHDAIKGQKVSCLMSMTDDSWDVDVVRDIFNDRDANLILSIPLRRTEDDVWFWRKERLGHYTVKSAYAVVKESADVNTSSSITSFWSKIWSKKVPLKVKHFIWRAARGCLPTRDMLLCKKVDVSITCPVCNIYDETAFHVLVTCPIAAQC